MEFNLTSPILLAATTTGVGAAWWSNIGDIHGETFQISAMILIHTC